MLLNATEWIEKIQSAVDQNSEISIALRTDSTLSKDVKQVIDESLTHAPEYLQNRLREEYLGWGPLNALVADTDITEIIINSPESIWFEKQGVIQQSSEIFLSPQTYQNFISRICHEINNEPNLEKPFASGRYHDFRVQMVAPPLTTSLSLTLRRLKVSGWSLAELIQKNWCTEAQGNLLRELIKERVNFLVAGTTGSGKTSVLNALIKEVEPTERVLILEDTQELVLPNPLSLKMETRFDPNGTLKDISLQGLLKQSLRMRPDRLVVGEVRDVEAKDLLLALSTGHAGSMGTIHAATAEDTLTRLEMLVQLGAPEWSLSTVRRMIQGSLQYILMTEKVAGCRKIKSLHRIASLEDFGFTLDLVI